jgi:hypothetical protein
MPRSFQARISARKTEEERLLMDVKRLERPRAKKVTMEREVQVKVHLYTDGSVEMERADDSSRYWIDPTEVPGIVADLRGRGLTEMADFIERRRAARAN